MSASSSRGGALAELGAVELSRAIHARDVSCLEVMQEYLDRLAALNPVFNAIVSQRDPELLLAEARERDEELDRGSSRGWMHGFPHAVKDLADVAGMVTTCGSPILRDFVAPADSLFVERIRSAGAIFVGKTNVPEFGLGSQTYNSVFGATLNPWDGRSTVGGSSGGAAAGLALRLLPVADGGDMMGSLRNPAGFNHVVGFRPSLGRVPSGPDLHQQLAVLGPMGRSVGDTAWLLATMAGFDSRDPRSLPADPELFRAPLDRDVGGTRIGWLADLDGYLAMEEGVLEVCTRALAHFESLGCIVEPARLDFPLEELWQAWLVLRHASVGSRLAPYRDDPATRELLKPEIVWEIEEGRRLSARDVWEATQVRARWVEALGRAFSRWDFLVLPTAQVFPFDASLPWPRRIGAREMDTYHRWMEVVIPGTLGGGPTIGVPAGFGGRGLPMGLQILGPPQQDRAVLEIAAAYEKAAEWTKVRPPESAAPSRAAD